MSTAPENYEPNYDFTDFQEGNPTTPLPADQLDTELGAIATAINATQARLAEIQNDDGTLKNGSVGAEQLAAGLVVGLNETENWATATAYVVNDAVYQSNNVYRCLVAHTSGTFATDLAAGKWALVVNFDQFLGAAEDSATAAAASAVAAATAETNAETAETNAEAALVSFQNSFLGSYSSAPATTPSGAALAEGMVYWNSTSNQMLVYNGSIWVPVVTSTAAVRSVSFANGDNSTTVFSIAYDVGLLDIYVGGVKQRVDTTNSSPAANYDVAASNGTSVTFAAAPATGTRNIQFIVLGAFSVADIAPDSIDTAQLVNGAVTPAKSEPGAYWYAIASNEDVYNIQATFNPPLPSLANGTVVHLRPRIDNGTSISVSISSLTSSGTTATAAATSHGLKVGDVVFITGANQIEYNGFIRVDTVPNANSFTYKFKGSSTTPATGTIEAVSPVQGGTYAGGVTFNPDSLGAKPIVRPNGGNLIPGDIISSQEISLIYNSAVECWVLQSGASCQFYSLVCSSTSGTAYSVTDQVFISSNATPNVFNIRMAVANTSTAPTLTLSNAGAALNGTIYREGGQPLRIGDISANGWSSFVWNGSHWELLNPKSSVNPVATLQHQASSGTSGGATTSGGWNTCPLTTEVDDADGIVSLSSNDFTLAAGTYLIRWNRQFQSTGATQTRLYNVTDASVVGYGGVTASAYGGNSMGEKVVTITSSKAFRLQYRSADSLSSYGLGAAANFGVTEVYSTVTIQKIA